MFKLGSQISTLDNVQLFNYSIREEWGRREDAQWWQWGWLMEEPGEWWNDGGPIVQCGPQWTHCTIWSTNHETKTMTMEEWPVWNKGIRLQEEKILSKENAKRYRIEKGYKIVQCCPITTRPRPWQRNLGQSGIKGIRPQAEKILSKEKEKT